MPLTNAPSTPVIAGQGQRVYRAPMAMLIKLLTFVALVLMPLGMGAAPAAAASHTTASAEHCPDTPTSPPAHSGKGDCTMACAAALPAVELSAESSVMRIDSPAPRIFAETLTGLHPETATPPPRFS